MKTHVENMDAAFKLKGKKLTKVEEQIVALMGSNVKYQMYLDNNGNVAYKLTNQ